jgi:large subunit ribosomal protein L4
MMAVGTVQERAAGARVTIERRSVAGELIDLVDLEPAIFGVVPNVALMHQVVTAQLAARRAGTQSTKTRSEVRGGGTKPYRQKGTGRARQGTVRAPQFAGGGVALGPKPRSYAQRTPRKMVRLALNSALSDRAAEGRVCLIDEWSFEVPKTKDAIRALRHLGLSGRVLVVLGSGDTVAERSFANLQHVHLVEGAQLTAYEVLANDWVLFTSETVPGGVTVSEESSSTVPSAALVDDSASDAPNAGAGAAADTGDAPAPVDATAAPIDADNTSAASAPAGDSAAGAGDSTGEPAGAVDDHAGNGAEASVAVETGEVEAEARAHDNAVVASGEAAESESAAIADSEAEVHKDEEEAE